MACLKVKLAISLWLHKSIFCRWILQCRRSVVAGTSGKSRRAYNLSPSESESDTQSSESPAGYLGRNSGRPTSVTVCESDSDSESGCTFFLLNLKI